MACLSPRVPPYLSPQLSLPLLEINEVHLACDGNLYGLWRRPIYLNHMCCRLLDERGWLGTSATCFLRRFVCGVAGRGGVGARAAAAGLREGEFFVSAGQGMFQSTPNATSQAGAVVRGTNCLVEASLEF